MSHKFKVGDRIRFCGSLSGLQPIGPDPRWRDSRIIELRQDPEVFPYLITNDRGDYLPVEEKEIDLFQPLPEIPD